MGEYMSKGTGVTLGTLGTIGFGLTAAQALGGGNGLLGGLFGGGNQMTAMASEIAKLKSEKYADHVGIDTYKQTRIENQDLQDRLLGNWIKPLAQEAASNRERLAVLETKVDNNKASSDKDLELMRKDIEISTLKLNAKVDAVTSVAHSGIAANAGAIAALQKVVDGIVCTKVCKDSICPEVMPRYNSWTSVEGVTAPAVQPVTGTIKTM